MVVTEGVASAGLAEGSMRTMLESITPLGRIGELNDIIPAVLFLASEDAGYITGETLHIAGGVQ